jgi:anti-anti-sigma regulatory factor
MPPAPREPRRRRAPRVAGATQAPALRIEAGTLVGDPTGATALTAALRPAVRELVPGGRIVVTLTGAHAIHGAALQVLLAAARAAAAATGSIVVGEVPPGILRTLRLVGVAEELGARPARVEQDS